MKKILATISMALATVAFANETTQITTLQTRKVKEPQSNQLNVGPDAFWQHSNEEKNGVTSKSNGGFGGVRLRYEYVKPDFFYSGTEGMFAMGRVTDETEKKGSTSTSISRNAFAANAEQRFGYTLGVRDIHPATLTPFVGIGWYYSKPVVDNKFSHDFVYANAGLKSNVDVTDAFAFGLTGKALYSFYDRTHIDGVVNTSWDNTAWGFEVDAPMTWHLNNAHTWNMTVEPYIQDLDVSKHFMNVGGRLLASYQF